MIIGLDVGGTHTDVVLLSKKGLEKKVKVPTDTSNLFQSVLSGIDEVTQGVETGGIVRIVLSTTLTTNAVVTENVEEAGMIVAAGPGINPEFFRTCDQYYTVKGAIDHRGREIEAVDEAEIATIAETFQKSGIKYVGVVGKFSTRNPAQEQKIVKLLERYGFDKIFAGHRVSGNLNFSRRIATTYLNASVYHIHKQFFEAVIKSLEEKGLDIPIHILKADGGTMNFDSSINYPGQTILSGPAASVMGAIPSAPSGKDVIVLDIGGTTTDISVLIDQSPVLEPVGITLKQYKTLIRSLQTVSVGIGGDSTVRFENGTITVGPDRKGPAMAYGGDQPTPTDALCVLEKTQDGDREKALSGIQSIADDMGVSPKAAAEKIVEITCGKILSEAQAMVDSINSKPVYTVHELLEGYTVNPSNILVLGGPAEEFAEQLGSLAGFDVKAVPECGVANAMGAGLARTTCEVTLFVDTEKGVILAPEENYTKNIKRAFTLDDAEATAIELLRKKSETRGADLDEFKAEIIERQEFNMVRGFRTTGKTMRIKTQVKPGLISGYTV